VASGKPILPRYRPSPQEGQYIRYRTNLAGMKLVAIAKRLSIDRSTVSNVIRGKRRSFLVESEIANILGKESWNDVVLEARSEIQKKPVELILREMEQKKDAANKASKKRMQDYIERDVVSSDLKARRRA